MNTKIYLAAVIAAACAATTNAQTYFAGDFSFLTNPNGSDQADVFTEGESPLNQLRLWGIDTSTPAEGGNPGAWLATGSYNAMGWVAVAAPTTPQEYTFSVDYRNSANPWNSSFDVLGVSSGEAIEGLGGQGENPTGGEMLLDMTLGNSGGEWVTASHSIVIPAGYEAVIFRFGINHNPDPLRGFDNVTIIPEPSTYASLFGALVLGIALWRRRAVGRR